MGTQLLGMSGDEVFDLTAEEIEARYDLWHQQEKRWDLRFGVVSSAYVNTQLKPGYPPVNPGSWFGYQDDDQNEMTPEETVAFMKQLVSAHNAQLPS